MSTGQAVFINELHYDNTGTDSNEGVEIAGPAGTDLSCYQIILYNQTGAVYNTVTLSGTIGDEGCGYGAIWFAIASIQNGSNDGLALYYDPSLCGGPGVAAVIQFLSYEGTTTGSAGPANGMTSTNIGVSEGSSTPVGQSLQLTGMGTTYTDFTWTGPLASSHNALNAGQDPCGGGCTLDSEPATASTGIGFSAIGCNGMTITFTGGSGSDYLVVVRSGSAVAGTPTDQTTYTANTAFGSGDVIAAGEFVVSSGTSTSVAVTGLISNTTYHVAVFDFNGAACEENYLTSSSLTGNQLTTTCSICPFMTSVFINACSGSCAEGDNELIFLNSGDFAIPVTATPAFDISYGNSPSPATSYSDNITTNAAALADMHTSAGCGGVFIDALAAGTIPAGAPFLLAHTDICASTATDFSAFCGSGPIYVLFSTDANWTSGGNFANSTTCSGGARYFQTDFTVVDPSCTIDYNYTCSNLSGTDGDVAIYGQSGGAPLSYIDDDCSLAITVLDNELVHFDANLHEQKVFVEWSIAEDDGSTLYRIERSSDNNTWQTVESLYGTGNVYQEFSVVDHFPMTGVSYYRLVAQPITAQGVAYAPKAVSFESGSLFGIEYAQIDGGQLQLRYFSDTPAFLEVFDVTGRMVYQSILAPAESDVSSHLLPQLSQSTYTIRLRTENQVSTRRLYYTTR